LYSLNNANFVSLFAIMKAIRILFNRSEITAGTRGASLGPDAVRIAARNAHSNFFKRYQVDDIPDENHLLDQETTHKFAKRIDGLLNVYSRLSQKMGSIFEKGEFPLLIAADHGSAGGTIDGIVRSFPGKRLGVIWIDAHADIHTPYTTPSGNLHGMPLATALSLDNKSCQINEVPNETIELWEKLKKNGHNGAKIRPEDLVYIAVRDTEPEEDHLIKELALRNIEVAELRKKGLESIVSEVLEKLKDCDEIYVSFDVDSMDPHLTSHGTGTPVDGGLTPEEAAGLLEGFASSKKTCCIEFVEVNPCLDEKKNRMAEVTFQLLERTVAAIENRG
jgi:arginase